VRQAPGRCRLIEEDLEKVIGNVLGKRKNMGSALDFGHIPF